MSGPFLYPYGVFPLTDPGEPIWSDALQDWMKPRYLRGALRLRRSWRSTPSTKDVKLAIEPVKSWETPAAQHGLGGAGLPRRPRAPAGRRDDRHRAGRHGEPGPGSLQGATSPEPHGRTGCYYVHISAPDRGAVRDSWIPWDLMLREIEPVYRGPYLVEVFNAIPPFDSSMRMARRRFWRPGEDDPEPDGDSAYDVAGAALETLREQLSRRRRRRTARPRPHRVEAAHVAPAVRSHHHGREARGRRPHPHLRLVLRATTTSPTPRTSSRAGTSSFSSTRSSSRPTRGSSGTTRTASASRSKGCTCRTGTPTTGSGWATAFSDVTVYALAETIDFIQEHGEDSRQRPLEAGRPRAGRASSSPRRSPSPGEETIDGVTYVFDEVTDTEIDFHLTIRLPELGVYFTQDLLYSGTHLYLTKHMDHWIRVLQDMLLSDYDLFMPGHGLPGRQERGRPEHRVPLRGAAGHRRRTDRRRLQGLHAAAVSRTHMSGDLRHLPAAAVRRGERLLTASDAMSRVHDRGATQ